jgi:hypothetical protein
VASSPDVVGTFSPGHRRWAIGSPAAEETLLGTTSHMLVDLISLS